MAVTSSVVEQITAKFRNFYNLKKSRFSLKMAQCVLNGCKDLFKGIKYILGLVHVNHFAYFATVLRLI